MPCSRARGSGCLFTMRGSEVAAGHLSRPAGSGSFAGERSPALADPTGRAVVRGAQAGRASRCGRARPAAGRHGRPADSGTRPERQASGPPRRRRRCGVCGKGTAIVLIPLPPAVGRAIDRAAGSRARGPILLNTRDTRMDRHAATRRLRQLAETESAAPTHTYLILGRDSTFQNGDYESDCCLCHASGWIQAPNGATISCTAGCNHGYFLSA
jgi:hypothetical protein